MSAGVRDSRLPGRRWQVRDVMTTEIASVDEVVPCKEAVQLMSEWTVSAIPVTDQDRRVLGMVSEADMLAKQERRSGRLALARRTRRKRAKAAALTAGQMMTAPAITIRPDAPLPTAARMMNAHRIRRLPVVDGSGKLLGVVSRRDLLTAFLRPDDEIAADVRAGVLIRQWCWHSSRSTGSRRAPAGGMKPTAAGLAGQQQARSARCHSPGPSRATSAGRANSA
jgi:CBS domain-containing protein